MISVYLLLDSYKKRKTAIYRRVTAYKHKLVAKQQKTPYSVAAFHLFCLTLSQ